MQMQETLGKQGAHQNLESEKDMLTIAPKTPALPTPTLASTRPKRTVRPPIRDDDPRYSLSSYSTRKRTAEQAKVVQTDDSGDLRTYAQAH
jgi:hypothetical protein